MSNLTGLFFESLKLSGDGQMPYPILPYVSPSRSECVFCWKASSHLGHVVPLRELGRCCILRVAAIEGALYLKHPRPVSRKEYRTLPSHKV